MTIEEKKRRLEDMCDSHSPLCIDCGRCPLYDQNDISCDFVGDYNAERAYEFVFGKEDTKDTEDMVNRPPHYTQGNIECIDAMVAAFGKEAVAYFCICNAFKYVWRSEQKNGKEDIDKTIWYLNKYVELKSNERTEAV